MACGCYDDGSGESRAESFFKGRSTECTPPNSQHHCHRGSVLTMMFSCRTWYCRWWKRVRHLAFGMGVHPVATAIKESKQLSFPVLPSLVLPQLDGKKKNCERPLICPDHVKDWKINPDCSRRLRHLSPFSQARGC